METSQLKKFAQFARRNLIEQVSAKLKLVLAEDSKARRESPKAVEEIEKAISHQGKAVSNQSSVISKSSKTTDGWGLTADGSKTDGLIEKVAYTWFNRFCALRFMDVNRYTRIGVVSPAEGQSQPEILSEAKMGYIDDSMVPEKIRQQIFALLDGSAPSQDPQSEAYRLLVVAICNYWYKAMPFLFERIDDYTELLMPDDLLSGNSILASTRDAMSPDACQDVEVIGWLYQFYISEKKDEVFAGLKKNRKITPENIPAATQLFTPHWIVRYLVENSLGRLWMLNQPSSKLVQQMDYYIKPEQPETDFLRITKPEELKICDPACGSGHMLTYAFDLLYSIYEEEGYEPSEIPEKILTHNLYGIEIDERAGELAAFALTMKARSKQRRFFRKQIQPNICVLENIRFEDDELDEYMDFIGRDLFTTPLQTTLRQFEEADNFGSLIRPEVTDVEGILEILEAKDVSGQLFLSSTHQKVLQSLKQADYLSQKYHVVIANPPYMGAGGMNPLAKSFVRKFYKDAAADYATCFALRNRELGLNGGYFGMITFQNWMFLGSFSNFRNRLLHRSTLASLVHNGRGVWGADFGSCAFIFFMRRQPELSATFRRLFNKNSIVQSNEKLIAKFLAWEPDTVFRRNTLNFERIPGNPIVYWLSEKQLSSFSNNPLMITIADVKTGLSTGKKDYFCREWYEVSYHSIGFDQENGTEFIGDAAPSWAPTVSGGPFRKWYGNFEEVIKWGNNGHEVSNFKGSTIRNPSYYFQEGITWSDVTISTISFRYVPRGCVITDVGPMAFVKSEKSVWSLLGLSNSRFVDQITKALNPTVHFKTGDYARIPTAFPRESIDDDIRQCVEIAKKDWDTSELSWGFQDNPILEKRDNESTLALAVTKLFLMWQEGSERLRIFEEKNNEIFARAFGLDAELTSVVTRDQVTLNWNPYYRYGGNKSEEEQEVLLLADTMREFISYAVGCMFGRYSLDAPGLILANQGDEIDDYHRIIQEKRKRPEAISNQQIDADDFTDNCKLNTDGSFSGFQPDEDDVIPILDGDWFTDDITESFFKFLRVTFGEEHYEENLNFIETAIGRNIRNYFLKHFYNDHVKRYKKRPIYWLFSSPKGSFNALIYMHRYRPDTVSVVLNDYLREFRTKLTSRKNQLEALSISASANKSEKTRALKEIEKINKMVDELDEYEREVLYPLATEQVEIDLDDGVKVNYNKFGKALKKIPGLTAKGN